MATAGLVAAAPAAAGSDAVTEAIDAATNKVGTPYRYGGTGPNAFDCSGLVQWSYRQAGVTLKRTTYEQVKQGTAVSRSNMRAGDLVFFYPSVSHVGIYLGDNKMVHAPSSGKRVQVVDMSVYYNGKFHSARRIS
ncbi:C40 family peptidase [Nocardiopsis ansamitocini]|nr:C40 family peptidase [Nocardiopsis ansamitocini]